MIRLTSARKGSRRDGVDGLDELTGVERLEREARLVDLGLELPILRSPGFFIQLVAVYEFGDLVTGVLAQRDIFPSTRRP